MSPQPIEPQLYVRASGGQLTHRVTGVGEDTAACGFKPRNRWRTALTPVRTRVDSVAHLCPRCFPPRADGLPRLPGEDL